MHQAIGQFLDIDSRKIAWCHNQKHSVCIIFIIQEPQQLLIVSEYFDILIVESFFNVFGCDFRQPFVFHNFRIKKDDCFVCLVHCLFILRQEAGVQAAEGM